MSPSAKYSGEGSDHSKLLELMKDPNVLYHHGEGGRTPLNEEQITAMVFSLMNKFQLIQGPPGEAIHFAHCRVTSCKQQPDATFLHAHFLVLACMHM